jgi:hypothetical protein
MTPTHWTGKREKIVCQKFVNVTRTINATLDGDLLLISNCTDCTFRVESPCVKLIIGMRPMSVIDFILSPDYFCYLLDFSLLIVDLFISF